VLSSGPQSLQMYKDLDKIVPESILWLPISESLCSLFLGLWVFFWVYQIQFLSQRFFTALSLPLKSLNPASLSLSGVSLSAFVIP
jgi:hypothetical protein